VPVNLIFGKTRARGNVVLNKFMVHDFEAQALGKTGSNVAPARTNFPGHCDDGHSVLRVTKRCRVC
jgi:hypothetical protein